MYIEYDNMVIFENKKVTSEKVENSVTFVTFQS